MNINNINPNKQAKLETTQNTKHTAIIYVIKFIKGTTIFEVTYITPFTKYEIKDPILIY